MPPPSQLDLLTQTVGVLEERLSISEDRAARLEAWAAAQQAAAPEGVQQVQVQAAQGQGQQALWVPALTAQGQQAQPQVVAQVQQPVSAAVVADVQSRAAEA